VSESAHHGEAIAELILETSLSAKTSTDQRPEYLVMLSQKLSTTLTRSTACDGCLICEVCGSIGRILIGGMYENDR